MALPSSPPRLPETDPPSSPLLPEGSGQLPIRPADPAIGPTRKRQFSDYGSLSSDPLFSDDASDADGQGRADEQPKRKRLVKGPWWSLHPASKQDLRRSVAKREKMRNVDSGVWLGSDDSIDSVLSSQQKMEALEVEDQHSVTAPHRPSGPELLAQGVIDDCLDTGRESVDITDLGLAHLSNATLKPLHQFIKHSHADLTKPPSEDEFTPLTPSIQLFISGNRLTSLPSELFRITDITVLSLRNNELSEIPPSIAHLSNLKELNIAQNKIKWLPWEMLDLMHSNRQIMVRPNPLVEPMGLQGRSPLPRPNVTPGEYSEHMSRWGETAGAFFNQMKQWYSEDGVPWTMRHELELRLKLGRARKMMHLQEASRAGREVKNLDEEMIYLTSSAVRYLDVDGSLLRPAGVFRGLTDREQFAAVVNPFVNRPEHADASKVPSLLETALRSAQANFCMQDIPDDIPPALRSGLDSAAKGVEYGNERCAVCDCQFIIARAEWMEYWFNGFPSQVDGLTAESVLPFLRRVCSWQCVQPHEIGAFRF